MSGHSQDILCKWIIGFFMCCRECLVLLNFEEEQEDWGKSWHLYYRIKLLVSRTFFVLLLSMDSIFHS